MVRASLEVAVYPKAEHPANRAALGGVERQLQIQQAECLQLQEAEWQSLIPWLARVKLRQEEAALFFFSLFFLPFDDSTK